MLLAKAFNPEKDDPTNWWISEKLDGVRVFWHSGKLNTRTGKEYNAPDWFKEEISKVGDCLDGELWLGRGTFDKVVSAVRKKEPIDSEWENVKYLVFDIPPKDKNDPMCKIGFEERMKLLEKNVKKEEETGRVVFVNQKRCKSIDHLFDELKEIEKYKGEGLMLRKPESLYEFKRSSTLLKVKSFFDAEGEVTGYFDGKGKYTGMVGSLIVLAKNGKTFKCGTGLNDEQRQNPPKIGDTITYKYFELTKDGIPRFPIFVCVRDYE